MLFGGTSWQQCETCRRKTVEVFTGEIGEEELALGRTLVGFTPGRLAEADGLGMSRPGGRAQPPGS